MQQYIWTSGPIVYPLIICSVLTLALIVERLVAFVFYPPLRTQSNKQWFMADSLPQNHKLGLSSGLRLLSEHRHTAKPTRDEVMSLWLVGESKKLRAHTRWLTLLSTMTPLLGLLGTILGIITMFQSVALEQGPVTPALLASGMWEAMITTALGLTIAIPAMAASHGFSIWADHRVSVMAQVLNECSLSLEQRA
ncbi:MAG: MotA/TolQ/ExbB proton channel family protein [Algicola sp.]|nr:MotA/TolQ/ExbB proton channel family protein [Algicola sp.]